MKSALIIIDLIEDIVGKNGLSNRSYEQFIERNILENSNLAIRHAREVGVHVIGVRVGFESDYHDIPQGSPMFKHAKEIGAFKLGQRGSSWLPDLALAKDDLDFIKKGVSAFAGNNLYDWLIENRIEKLYIGGVSSLLAVQSTVREAHDLGFYVTVIDDLCAAATLEQHIQSMAAVNGLAEVIMLKDFLLSNI